MSFGPRVVVDPGRPRHRYRDHLARAVDAFLRSSRHRGRQFFSSAQGDFLPIERENWSFEAVHLHNATRTRQPGTTGPQETSCRGTITTWEATPNFTARHCRDFANMTLSNGTRRRHVTGVADLLADLEPFYGVSTDVLGAQQQGRGPHRSVALHRLPVSDCPRAPWPDLSIPLDRKGCTHFRDLKRWIGATVAPACVTHATRSPAWWTPKATRRVRRTPCAGSPVRKCATADQRAGARLRRPDGKHVPAAQITHRGQRILIRAERFVVACGAVNTAALLLRSASTVHPNRLANSSDQVGAL
jgi:hypothetical protein